MNNKIHVIKEDAPVPQLDGDSTNWWSINIDLIKQDRLVSHRNKHQLIKQQKKLNNIRSSCWNISTNIIRICLSEFQPTIT